MQDWCVHSKQGGSVPHVGMFSTTVITTGLNVLHDMNARVVLMICRGSSPLDPRKFVGLTGAQIFHEMMIHHNVKQVCTEKHHFSVHSAQVFGYPGGAILPVFDAIYNSKHFNFVLPRHEQGGGHMAEGYARAR